MWIKLAKNALPIERNFGVSFCSATCVGRVAEK
jgi:hypothetical protein